MQITAAEIQLGDVILPPERELRLWMRRHIQEKNLPERALYLTVAELSEAKDKGGRWIVVKSNRAPEWGQQYPMTFRTRPATPWPLIDRPAAKVS